MALAKAARWNEIFMETPSLSWLGNLERCDFKNLL
jgi:hypothetical protein